MYAQKAKLEIDAAKKAGGGVVPVSGADSPSAGDTDEVQRQAS